jgi:hypothetical protein
MNPKPGPTNLAASVRARLLNVARRRGDEFQLVLSEFATERFLHRLGSSRFADRFVLKGAMVLRLWSSARYRATWDVDLMSSRLGSVEAIVFAIREICAIESDDGLAFDPASMITEEIRGDEEYDGIRIRFEWDLAGARIPQQIDVAVGGDIVPPPTREKYPTLLGQDAPRILAYSREVVVAEKLEAILSLGPTNSRMKDYYDLWTLASHFEFEGTTLTAAIRSTFERRGTAFPEGDPPEFTRTYLTAPERRALWASFWRRSRPSEPLERVESMAEVLSAFLLPVLVTIRRGKSLEKKWSREDGWR